MVEDHMRSVLVVAMIVSGAGLEQTAAPQVVPLLSDGTGSGFVLEMVNTTGAELRVVKGLGHCRYRIDGVEERYSGGGSSGGSLVAPGGKWQEVVKFVSDPPNGRRPVDALWPTVAAWRQALVELTPGRHVVSFRCGRAWSADLAFYWTAPAK